MNRFPKYVYPSSVTMVNVQSGNRFRLFSDIKSGQEGHADSDENYDVYLPNVPALLKTRPGLEKHPRFQEGEYTKEDKGEFAVSDHGVGISLAHDPKFREVIVPVRGALAVNVIDVKTKKTREINLQRQIQTKNHTWLQPSPDFLNGLAFHPDGIHYILSTTTGFIAVERGTHRLNPAMTFPLPLMIHSHLRIV